MSIPATDSLDIFAQMAPHITIQEPLEAHPHRDLYHPMILREKAIADSATTSVNSLASRITIQEPLEPHPRRDLYHPMIIREKAIAESHSCRLCRYTHTIIHKLRAHLPAIHHHHHHRDVEKDAALHLLERAKVNKLAQKYNANASSENLLLKRQKSMSNVSSSGSSSGSEEEEPMSGEIISVRSSFADYTMLKAACVAGEEIKNGISVT
ncbi:MAG: hypothetical protein Q9168_006885, partial [Polycauliona sp. 1 TL-2023]